MRGRVTFGTRCWLLQRQATLDSAPKSTRHSFEGLHPFFLSELEWGQGGCLIDPSHAQPSMDWVDHEFMLNRL